MKYVLLTSKTWFIGPDGRQYRAVFGELISAQKGFMQVGSVSINEKEVLTIIETDNFSSTPESRGIQHEGKIVAAPETYTHIYDARPTNER